MIKVGIIGVSGYTGKTLLELLLDHPQVRVVYVSANNTQGKISDLWPHLKGKTNLVCKKFNLDTAQKSCDFIFLSVPHTIAMTIVPALQKKGIPAIDLSGDYRLEKAAEYRLWYGKKHTDRQRLKKAVYGLPELYRENIKKATLIANPGCYPTAAVLGLMPIISTQQGHIRSITIDAKSGVSGAGRKSSVALSFAETNENFKAYKALKHQHAPEIDLYLSKVSAQTPKVDFVPHLLPVNTGILATIYVRLEKKQTLGNTHKVYQRFYKTEPFVRVLEPGQQPELKHVVNTNYCDIGLAVNNSGDLLVVTAAIDNLIKGAAGQAVQNMNIMNGFPETQGLP